MFSLSCRAPLASEKGVSTNETPILCIRESSSQTPMSSQVWPSCSEMDTAALQASAVKAVSVPMGRVSRAASRATSNANLSLPSVVMPFQLFSLPGQSFWGGVEHREVAAFRDLVGFSAVHP